MSVWKEGNDAPKANIGGCEGLSGSPGGSDAEQGEKQPGDKPISPLCPIVGGKATLHGSQFSSKVLGFLTHFVQLLREQPATSGGFRVVTHTRAFHPLPSLSQDTCKGQILHPPAASREQLPISSAQTPAPAASSAPGTRRAVPCCFCRQAEAGAAPAGWPGGGPGVLEAPCGLPAGGAPG